MNKVSKIDKNLYHTLFIVIGLEIVLCGIQQFILGKPYSIFYAVITVAFVAFQTTFTLNAERFADGRKGIKLFFLYKVVKVIVMILPLLAYVVMAEQKVNVWIPIRVVAYYFVFLIVETAVAVKYQKSYKSSVYK